MEPAVFTGAVEGFALGAGLIIAIGAQNAFVLRQGLIRQYVLAVAGICFVSDAALIFAGVAGFGAFVSAYPLLIVLVTGVGAVFLFVYGALALYRAWHPGRLEAAANGAGSLRAAMLTALALTWLNPHVYLDTVVMLGGLSGRYENAPRAAFGIGAAAASFVWFFALGYGARLLAPLFRKPAAWRLLDLVIAAVMWAIAGSLALSLL
ncbi:MAG: LysE/ArgO family amino acid transporter [Fimbriimonadaceae bacterium]|nr:LysE/ArgO family amino acid transporter [Alphaproteobacteria bacterium]